MSKRKRSIAFGSSSFHAPRLLSANPVCSMQTLGPPNQPIRTAGPDETSDEEKDDLRVGPRECLSNEVPTCSKCIQMYRSEWSQVPLNSPLLSSSSPDSPETNVKNSTSFPELRGLITSKTLTRTPHPAVIPPLSPKQLQKQVRRRPGACHGLPVDSDPD